MDFKLDAQQFYNTSNGWAKNENLNQSYYNNSDVE